MALALRDSNPASPTWTSFSLAKRRDSPFERALCPSRCKRRGTRSTRSNSIVAVAATDISARAPSPEHSGGIGGAERVRDAVVSQYVDMSAAGDYVASVPPGSTSGVATEERNI